MIIRSIESNSSNGMWAGVLLMGACGQRRLEYFYGFSGLNCSLGTSSSVSVLHINIREIGFLS